MVNKCTNPVLSAKINFCQQAFLAGELRDLNGESPSVDLLTNICISKASLLIING